MISDFLRIRTRTEHASHRELAPEVSASQLATRASCFAAPGMAPRGAIYVWAQQERSIPTCGGVKWSQTEQLLSGRSGGKIRLRHIRRLGLCTPRHGRPAVTLGAGHTQAPDCFLYIFQVDEGIPAAWEGLGPQGHRGPGVSSTPVVVIGVDARGGRSPHRTDRTRRRMGSVGPR